MRRIFPFGRESRMMMPPRGVIWSPAGLSVFAVPLANGVPIPQPTHGGSGVVGWVFFVVVIVLVAAAIAWLVRGVIEERRSRDAASKPYTRPDSTEPPERD